jgi:hypothetical protein
MPKPSTTEIGTVPTPAPGTAVATTRKPRPKPTTRDKTPPPVPVAPGMDGLIALALQQEAPVEALEKLLALKERVDAQTAAKAFFAAKAAFQIDCPPIRKEAKVAFAGGGGDRVSYSYAPLDDIDRIVRPIANRHGLSYSWRTSVEETRLTAVCVLRHVDGHSEEAPFTCPTTTRAGMSEQQKYGAATTYAMRWSLIQVLGLITTDDTDTKEVDPTPISADQLVSIEELLEAKRETVRTPEKLLPKFLKFMGVEKLAEIRATDYEKAVQALTPKADEKSDDGKGDA